VTARTNARRTLTIAAALAIAVVACGPSGGASPSAGPVTLKVGLGYIPSVQFAQFYLAQQGGY
jgi:ABC-type nitrate/sulfonate/bicarbonate transport system substrate-binding protein